MPADPFRLGFCVSGGGHLFRAVVRVRRALGVAPAWLLAEAGAAPDLEAFAAAHGVAVERLPAGPPARVRAALAAALAARPADLTCLTFDRVVPPEAIPPPGRMVNVHMSLLPAFPGRGGLGQALAAGARFAGATLHEVTAEVDAGPIVAQCAQPVEPGDTAATLGARLYPHLRAMVLQAVAWYAAGRVERGPDGRPRVRGARGGWPVSPAPERDWSAVPEEGP